MLRRIIVIVAMFMALGVLGLLLMKTQSQPLELQSHSERLSHLERVLELEAATDREIARARLALDAEPPGLETAVQGLDAARQRMRGSWLSKDALPAELDKAARDYFSKAGAKTELLVRYRGELEGFFGAFKQMRKLVDPLVAELGGDSNAGLRRDIMGLLSELTSYCIQSNPDNGATVATLEAQISNESRKLGNASLQRGTDRLLAAVDSVRSAKDGLRGTTEELSAIQTGAALQDARRRYYSHYAAQESTTARYRLALAIYAAALLAVFGLGGWRLRRSYAELDAANAGLEELVAVRTKELSSALLEVRAQQTQLIQSEKMASLGQLVAGVAHEINTPLGYARSNVETVRDSLPALRTLVAAYESALPADLAAEHAQQLQQAKKRWDPVESPEEMHLLLTDAEHGLVQITDLVLSLKDFSRVDRSHTERFDINAGIETALKICQGQLKHKIEIERDFAELPLVHCAPSQLNQVFLNLITNAAQAMGESGILFLRTYRDGDHVLIAIADNGCGMDAETQAHIFEPFFTTKDVGKGTGLGLSIVFRILEDHKGSIAVKSAPGQGTEFTIRLPIGGTPKEARPAVAAVSEST